MRSQIGVEARNEQASNARVEPWRSLHEVVKQVTLHLPKTPHGQVVQMRLKIRHNMEVAHRLSLDTGKCQQIHGHGMQVELELLVEEGSGGMAVNSAGETLEFGDMKRKFRGHIDSLYDHRLVLNEEDSFAQPIYLLDKGARRDGFTEVSDNQVFLPGLSLVPGDPTVENLAKWIAMWSAKTFRCDVICRIDETRTNGAEVMYHWNGFSASMVKGAR